MLVLLVLARQRVAAWWVIPESLAPVSYIAESDISREPVVSGPPSFNAYLLSYLKSFLVIIWWLTYQSPEHHTESETHISEYKLRSRIQNTSTLPRNHTWGVFWILGRATVK